MGFFKRLPKNHLWAILVTLLLTGYQLARLIAFINVYGGIEHDGGWMLSISRSLAEQGTYTTMVSTIVDPNVAGAINVDQKFDIQAPDGRIWFFTGNGIGPSSIVPDALVLKIFGANFWALRAGPLIFYTLMLLLAAYILYRLAGLGALVLLHAFLFFYPHLSIFLGYEAMGEVPAMFYVLWAYLAFGWAVAPQNRRRSRFLLAGLVIGLAINAKLIALWSLSGIFIWAGLGWLAGLTRRWRQFSQPSLRLGELAALAGGTILPPVLWEAVHLVILTRLTNFELYGQHVQQRIKFILDDGSGVGLQLYSGAEFFWDKFFILQEVAHPQRWVTAIIFATILAGGLAWLWGWRRQPHRQNLLATLWLGWLVNTIWFVSLAKTGWPRHFWFGLVLAMLLLCIITAASLQYGWRQLRFKKHDAKFLNVAPLALAGGMLALIIWGFVSQPHVWGFFVPDEMATYWQEKQMNNKYHASLPWVIIPRQAQTKVLDYIAQMPPEAHIYYPGGHKSAEIPPQTGRLHYPLGRRNFIKPHPADVVLISPSIISPWQDPIRRQDLLALVERECPRPALKNDYYMICPIADNPPQP